MDQAELESALSHLPIPAIVYRPKVGSTNDLAAAWAARGAPDLTLIVADEQTSGRGRAGRRWHTPPGTALAFSLVLQNAAATPPASLARLSALGALAVCEALEQGWGQTAQIKWPNDVLLDGRKTAGVLAEAQWQGDRLEALILGIGVNIAAGSLPPAEDLDFPATCLEQVLGQAVERPEVLARILAALFAWRPRLESPALIQAWERRLAYRGGMVRVLVPARGPLEGRLVGLDAHGGLRLAPASGPPIIVQAGDLRLRPKEE